MVLTVTFMYVNLVSCSGDDEPGAGVNDSEVKFKRLVEVKVDDNAGKGTYHFDYNNEDKVVRSNSSAYDGNDASFSWSQNKVVESTIYWECSYSYSNGLIESMNENGHEVDLTYNQSKNLTKAIQDGGMGHYTYSYSWQNGKLMKFTYGYKKYGEEVEKTESIYTFSYSNQTCKGFLPIAVTGIVVDYYYQLFWVHPEMVGMKIVDLPTKAIVDYEDGYNRTENYSYTFDNEGYVKSMTIEHKYSNGEISIESYNFVWEE